MHFTNNKNKNLKLFFLIFSICFLFGCKAQPKPQESSGSEENKKQAPPSALEDILDQSEEIIKSLEKVDDKKLKEIIKIIPELQGKWTSLWPKAKEAGASEELKKQFESSLNHLTNILSVETVENLDQQQAMHASILLTKTLPEFMDLFKFDIPTDLYRLKFLCRDLYAYTSQNNWEMAKEDMKQILVVWKTLQPEITKKDKQLTSELEYAIEQLINVIAQNDPNLTKVKVKDIMLKIIDKIEKKYEE